MFKSFDRYVVKEIVSPFLLGLSVYTFTMLIGQIQRISEVLISRGISFSTFVQLILYLMPFTLAFTIPMSTLMGVLAGLSRMSTDSEIVALRTMGIKNFRILKPVLIFSVTTFLISAGLSMFITPIANFQLNKLFTKVARSRIITNVKPKTICSEFQSDSGYLLYFDEIDQKTNAWKNILLFPSHQGGKNRTLVVAENGKLENTDPNDSHFALYNATVHSFEQKEPIKNYIISSYKYKKKPIKNREVSQTMRSSRHLTFPELIVKIREIEQSNLKNGSKLKNRPFKKSSLRYRIEMHRQLTMPLAAIILSFLGLSLGISTKKGGKATGFIISLAVIFLYYILITSAENLTNKRIISPFLGMWGPLIVLSLISIAFYFLTAREMNLQWRRISIFLRKVQDRINRFRTTRKSKIKEARKGKLKIKILDYYIIKKILFIFALIFFSLLFVFYISSVIDLVDEAVNNNTSFFLVLEYVFWKLPENIGFILPVSVLTSVLLTFSFMSKNNEITAVQASGISIQRLALPALFLGLAFSFFYLLFQENVVPQANIIAKDTFYKIKNRENPSLVGNRQSVLGKNKTFYFYNGYFNKKGEFEEFNIIQFDEPFYIKKRTYAKYAIFNGNQTLRLEDGFTREFTPQKPLEAQPFEKAVIKIPEGREFFSKKIEFPEFMNISEMKQYIQYLERNKSDTTKYKAELMHKYAFPLSSIIMVLLAIPFSFIMGKKGTLFGIGIAIGISMIYWGMSAFFKSFGQTAILSPVISGFGPIIVFALASIWMFFYVKT